MFLKKYIRKVYIFYFKHRFLRFRPFSPIFTNKITYISTITHATHKVRYLY